MTTSAPHVPPDAILVTWCPVCGRVSLAMTKEDKRRDNVSEGTCELCPADTWKTDHAPKRHLVRYQLTRKRGDGAGRTRRR